MHPTKSGSANTQSAPMTESPITAVLGTLHALDLDAALAMFADTGTLLRTDGQRAEGIEQVRPS